MRPRGSAPSSGEGILERSAVTEPAEFRPREDPCDRFSRLRTYATSACQPTGLIPRTRPRRSPFGLPLPTAAGVLIAVEPGTRRDVLQQAVATVVGAFAVEHHHSRRAPLDCREEVVPDVRVLRPAKHQVQNTLWADAGAPGLRRRHWIHASAAAGLEARTPGAVAVHAIAVAVARVVRPLRCGPVGNGRASRGYARRGVDARPHAAEHRHGHRARGDQARRTRGVSASRTQRRRGHDPSECSACTRSY